MQPVDDKGDILSLLHRMEIPKVENSKAKELIEVLCHKNKNKNGL